MTNELLFHAYENCIRLYDTFEFLHILLSLFIKKKIVLIIISLFPVKNANKYFNVMMIVFFPLFLLTHKRCVFNDKCFSFHLS